MGDVRIKTGLTVEVPTVPNYIKITGNASLSRQATVAQFGEKNEFWLPVEHLDDEAISQLGIAWMSELRTKRNNRRSR